MKCCILNPSRHFYFKLGLSNRLLMINHIQNKSCLYTCVCVYFIYAYKYTHQTHTHVICKHNILFCKWLIMIIDLTALLSNIAYGQNTSLKFIIMLPPVEKSIPVVLSHQNLFWTVRKRYFHLLIFLSWFRWEGLFTGEINVMNR